MNKERFDELIKNPSIVKFGDLTGVYFINDTENIVIAFVFAHRGFPTPFYGDREERINLIVFPATELIEPMPSIKISNSLIVLANYDNPEYALTYEIILNSENKSVSVRILDMPELGDSIITKQELEGLTISY